MSTNNRARTALRTATLNVETLEGRIVPSSTLYQVPPPAAVAVTRVDVGSTSDGASTTDNNSNSSALSFNPVSPGEAAKTETVSLIMVNGQLVEIVQNTLQFEISGTPQAGSVGVGGDPASGGTSGGTFGFTLTANGQDLGTFTSNPVISHSTTATLNDHGVKVVVVTYNITGQLEGGEPNIGTTSFQSQGGHIGVETM
jgi:hypothetical protein